jgi:hypothetical protein
LLITIVVVILVCFLALTDEESATVPSRGIVEDDEYDGMSVPT